MKIKLFIFFILGTFVSVNAQKTITGLVRDNQTGEPLTGVTVSIQGTTTGTITDIEGNYSIEATSTDTLVFSYVGFIAEHFAVNSQQVINVSLEPDLISMQEVVVVGYGTMKKENVTGSIALVKAEDMENRPNNQIGSLIQGKAAGVMILTNSGKPSQGFNIRVRGTNSINASSEPLYVVDGVPTNDTRSINPSDIESITVLKDASSAAIYGAQGANGVVLITTKRGKTENTTVTLDAYMGMSNVWNTISVLNAEQYRDLMTEMGQSTNWDLYNYNTDWQDKIFQTGISQNYQLSFSGSSDKTDYYVSGGWIKQEGAVRSSKMERANFKINLDQEVNKWLKVGTHVAYTRYNDVDVNDNSGVGNGGVLIGALFTPPVIDVFNEDGTYTSNPFQNWENPLSRTDALDRGYAKDRLLGNVFAEIEFLKGLSFKTNLGIDYQNGMFDSFLDPYSTSYGRTMNGISINNIDKTNFYIFDNTLQYKKDIDKHSFSALAGSVVQKYKWENSALETHNFASDNIKTPNAGSIIANATADKSEKANASYIGRITYNYDEKYLLTANFRADGSSNFGPDEKWGFFPSLSVGWRLSKEQFMSNIANLSDIKIRAGWGIVGNDQIGNYAFYGKTSSGANYPIGGVALPGTYPSSIQNDALKWEESEQTNVGIDLSLFNYRVTFTADAYLKKTDDLLLNAPLPTTTGFSSAVQNIGKLENKGLEFSLNTKNTTGEIKWSSDFNISFNKNKVTDLVGQEIYNGSIASRGNASLAKEGESLGILYGYIWGGVDPTTGNGYYIDNEGNSTFSPDADADRVIIGDANPDFFFGFGNSLSYKNLSLNIFIQGMIGNDMLNATRIEGEAMSTPANQMHDVVNRWREPGDETDIPKATFGVTDNSRISTRFVEDASYVRLKSVNLTYLIPQRLTKSINIEALKIYVTGENLLTFTDYSGYDPEVNNFKDSNTERGIDYGTYPQTRNIIFGINVTF